MDEQSKTEVILFTRSSLRDWREKELVWWLITSGQFVIAEQESKAKKFLVENLRDTPAIYLS